MKELKKIIDEIGSRSGPNRGSLIDNVKVALQKRDLSEYNKWQEGGFNVNHMFYGKDTLLYLVAERDNIEMAKALLEGGANVNAVCNNGKTAFYNSVVHGNIKMMKLLIENGANVNVMDKFKNTPLRMAICQAPDCLIVVKVLIENGADVNSACQIGATPLHFAAGLCDIDVVIALIESGADVNAVDSLRETPLHEAARYGDLDIVQVLIENGANINAVDEHCEKEPLHLAAEHNHLEVVKYLTDQGADLSAKDVNGKVPLDYAREKEHREVAKYLESKVVEISESQHESIQTSKEGKSLDPKTLFGVDNMAARKKIDVKKEEPKKEKSKCLIQSSRVVNFSLSEVLSPYLQIESVEQGLYLPSFEKRGVKINGKCVAITGGLSQALFLQSDKSFLSNLKASAKIYERIAQGKQISKMEEREVFAFSKLLNNFERQLDSATNSLPSSLIHNKAYKTFSDLSNYTAGIKSDFAIHLVTSNHVVAIYRTDDNYAYFDSNTAFVSGLESVDQLTEVVEKAVKFAGYEGFLVEHFDVDKANSKLSNEDKQILAKEIKTERQLLAEQDKKLGPIKINGQELSRVQLYDFGTKINVEGSVPLLINADMNLSSEKFQDHLGGKEVNMTAREYLDNLKNSKNVEEVAQVTKFIPFIGSKREVEKAEQTRNPKQFLLEQLVKGTINFILATASLANTSRSESQVPGKADDKPRTCLNEPTVNKQLQRSL